MEDYVIYNKANWDDRAPAHAASPGYAVDRFLTEHDYLSDVVRFDRDRLGSIVGLNGLHLQCHIGTDTVSLARLGAKMTGLDFSSASLKEARSLADSTGVSVDFVESEVYRALEVLNPESFDLIYTGIGALCWLPNVAAWAKVVSGLLRPGGRLFLREGHPMLFTIDERHEDRLVVDYPYFERQEPMIFDDGGTYVATDAAFTHNKTYEWTHGLGDVIGALLDSGMLITDFVEHDSVPWEAIPGQMVRDEASEWRLIDRPWRLAASYTLQARKGSIS